FPDHPNNLFESSQIFPVPRKKEPIAVRTKIEMYFGQAKPVTRVRQRKGYHPFDGAPIGRDNGIVGRQTSNILSNPGTLASRLGIRETQRRAARRQCSQDETPPRNHGGSPADRSVRPVSA